MLKLFKLEKMDKVMHTFLTKLTNRAGTLGNCVRKHRRAIELYGERMVRRLEERQVLNQVHLWKEAPNPAHELEVICQISATDQEMRTFLGCYYAIQFLHINFAALDALFLSLTARQDNFKMYKRMLFQVGINLRKLNTAYMTRLLDIFLEPRLQPEFSVCGVGTRADQDDLDIGIIDDGSPSRKQLNQAIGRLNGEMIKWAVPLHFHLSLFVGQPGYTASIDEYNELLEREIHDFIIISEMLGAKLILGSPQLFQQFEDQVTARYYFHKNLDNIYHEGYLRGILGEVRSLLLQQVNKDLICPKDDGMRMLRGLIYAQKTIYGIKSANNYEILSELKERDQDNRNIYADIEAALLFFETFRFLYQLLITHDEEISLASPEARANLTLVAEHMGYTGIGCIQAYDRLMTHYFEYSNLARLRAERILELITRHLQSISSFSLLASGQPAQHNQNSINVAEEFLDLVQFFRGTRFWDDVVYTLEADNAAFLKKWVQDLVALTPEKRALVITRIAEMSQSSFYGLFALIVIMHRHANQLADKKVAREINQRVFQVLRGTEDEARRMARVFSYYPRLVNDYLMTLSADEHEKLKIKMEITIEDPEISRWQNKLRQLTRLYCCTSRYFKRFFLKVAKKYPDYVFLLDETSTLEHIANGFLGDIERHSDFKKKKELLGDFYNIEFLRTGLDLLGGASVDFINAEFTGFSDTYLQTLYDICKMQMDEDQHRHMNTHDLLALYVTGGHARCQAFDDDYDLIVLLNSDDPELLHYASQIISRMNAEIIRRGVLPHFRLSEYTGHYVTRVSELAEILSHRDASTFINQAQVLGARKVVGSSIFDSNLEISIIQPYIFATKKQFITDLVQEMRSRQQGAEPEAYDPWNIKECKGGLRDLELSFLILKAYYELREPITNDLIEKLCTVAPDQSMIYWGLKEFFDRIKHLRDIYRIMVSPDDTLNPDFFEQPAKILGLIDQPDASGHQQLLHRYRAWTFEAHQTIQNLLTSLGLN